MEDLYTHREEKKGEREKERSWRRRAKTEELRLYRTVRSCVYCIYLQVVRKLCVDLLYN